MDLKQCVGITKKIKKSEFPTSTLLWILGDVKWIFKVGGKQTMVVMVNSG